MVKQKAEIKPRDTSKFQIKPKEPIEKIVRNRYVAIFDIIGFSEKVKNHNHDFIYNELSELKDVLEEVQGHPIGIDGKPEHVTNGLKYILFSDTIVLLSEQMTNDDFESIYFGALSITQYCLSNSIPIKGAIARGEISYNEKSNILFGKPIIDAYRLSEDMKFMGVLMDKSLHFLPNTCKDGFMIFLKVPLKSGKIKHYVMDIAVGINVGALEIYKENVIEGINNMYATVNSEPRIYYDNTLELIELMQNDHLSNQTK
jgi:hypothetical protein